jgi:hypothetical protein
MACEIESVGQPKTFNEYSRSPPSVGDPHSSLVCYQYIVKN